MHPLGVEPHRSGGTKIKQIKQISSFRDTRECQETVNKVISRCSSDSQTAGNDWATHILLYFILYHISDFKVIP